MMIVSTTRGRPSPALRWVKNQNNPYPHEKRPQNSAGITLSLNRRIKSKISLESKKLNCIGTPEAIMFPPANVLQLQKRYWLQQKPCWTWVSPTSFLPRFLHSFLSSSLGLISVLMRSDSIRAFASIPPLIPFLNMTCWTHMDWKHPGLKPKSIVPINTHTLDRTKMGKLLHHSGTCQAARRFAQDIYLDFPPAHGPHLEE